MIDEVDRKIIEILRRNARTPYTIIAKELGVSEAAIRKRIDKLIKKGVIKRFTVDVELEDEVKSVVFVKVAPPYPVPEISRKIRNVPGVDIVYEVTGDYDIMAIIKGNSIAQVNKSIDMIRSIEGVAGTNSLIILRTWY